MIICTITCRFLPLLLLSALRQNFQESIRNTKILCMRLLNLLLSLLLLSQNPKRVTVPRTIYWNVLQNLWHFQAGEADCSSAWEEILNLFVVPAFSPLSCTEEAKSESKAERKGHVTYGWGRDGSGAEVEEERIKWLRFIESRTRKRERKREIELKIP